MATQVNQRLTTSQIEYYNREGYLIYDQPVLPQASFDKLKTHFDAKLEALDPSVRPEAMDVPHFTDTALFEWLFSDAVLDLVEPILGPNIALWSSHFICKPKGDGKRVPWHEDSAYWRGRLDPMQVCTVWLAIDPSTKTNGCMYVVPRTHDNGYSDYEPVDATKNVFHTEITPSQRRDQTSVAIELAPNYASLHDGKLIHGSPPNNSDQRRCGYTMRYMPTSVKMAPQDGAAWPHQIYLARGRDLAGNAYADPSKTYNNVMKQRIDSGKKFH
jgi:Phytanoyl-CoA dioxygenase (PhyH)